jgi:ribose transport system ATP-binding protein
LGILTGMTVEENVGISALRGGSRWGFVRHRRARHEAANVIKAMNVQPPGCATMPMLALSGGNQQKALLGRVSMTKPDLYILCEPTRGVDLPARAAIRAFIRELRDTGAAVVVITVDVDDALATADRIAVVDAGRISEWFPTASTSAEQLLELAS